MRETAVYATHRVLTMEPTGPFPTPVPEFREEDSLVLRHMTAHSDFFTEQDGYGDMLGGTITESCQELQTGEPVDCDWLPLPDTHPVRSGNHDTESVAFEEYLEKTINDPSLQS